MFFISIRSIFTPFTFIACEIMANLWRVNCTDLNLCIDSEFSTAILKEIQKTMNSESTQPLQGGLVSARESQRQWRRGWCGHVGHVEKMHRSVHLNQTGEGCKSLTHIDLSLSDARDAGEQVPSEHGRWGTELTVLSILDNSRGRTQMCVYQVRPTVCNATAWFVRIHRVSACPPFVSGRRPTNTKILRKIYLTRMF